MPIQSPLLRRTLALLLLAAVIASAWLFAGAPVIAMHAELDDLIDHNKEMLVRYLRHAATRDGLEKRIGELRRAPSTGEGFLEGNSVALASAHLVKTVKTVVAASGGKLSSTQVLPSKEGERFQQVSVRVTMTADIETVQKVLHALEAGRPYLFLDELNIRQRRARSRRKVNRPPVSRLQVRFNVYGFMNPGAS